MTSATPAPRSARREATRARLLAAAAEAFAERGLYGTSVEDICERAGFTRGAFYSNFASREDLVVELAAQRADIIQARLGELTRSGENLSPSALMRGVLDLWEDPAERQQGHLLQTELMLHAARDPKAGRAWSDHVTRTVDGIAALLNEYSELHRITLPISVDDLARLLFATFMGGGAQHLAAPELVGADQLETALGTLVEHAIGR